MGGPASPFLLNLAYDPIVFSFDAATGVTPPTYVDDLAALTHGAEHTMRLEICLVIAGKLAGLHTDNHTWTWGEGIGEASKITTLLKALPVEVTEMNQLTGSGFAVRGLPSIFVHSLVSCMPRPTWDHLVVRADSTCRCKVKAVLVASE
eukprot:8245177-Heterocapsa_arctica.AAC.1